MKRWLFKIYRYGGGTSVMRSSDDRAEVEAAAAEWNDRYHTDVAFVEENRKYNA